MSDWGRTWFVLCLGLGLLGCSRQAPSPEECVAFTEMLVGGSHEEVLQYPELKAQFDAVVVACLTEPFERRVFTCTKESRAPLACLQRYQPTLLKKDDELSRGSRRVRRTR